MVPETTDPPVATTTPGRAVLRAIAVGVLVSVGVALVQAGLTGFSVSGTVRDFAPEFRAVQRFEHVGTGFVVAGVLALVAVIFLRRFVRNWWLAAAAALLCLPVATVMVSELMFEITRRLI